MQEDLTVIQLNSLQKI